MKKQRSLFITLGLYIGVLFIGWLVYSYTDNHFNVFIATFLADIAMTVLIFVASVAFNNSSLYDPYWSVIPVFIVLVWIVELNMLQLLPVMLFIGVLFWGLRLTRNWAMDFKGFTHEDFRYVDFREKFKNFYWVISFLVVHMFPTILVFISLYPIYFVLNNTINYPLFIYLALLFMLLGATISLVADGQLRAHKEAKNKQSIFIGLWRYSRHPNYFGEVLFWFGVAIASLAIQVSFIPFIGFISMMLLFNFYSVPKMEDKLLKNKDDYTEIIQSVPRFFIRFPKGINSIEDMNTQKKEAL